MSGGSAGKPRAYGAAKARKERDEDLLLFREMFKREKEKERNVASLLEPVSIELESSQAGGSFPLYRLRSGKKERDDFLGAEKEKNDYDWLKTPPATPLFPSLEMEANDPCMVFQRELPMLHHIKPSRFSAKMEETKPDQRPRSPSARSTASTRSDSSSRSETPRARPTPPSAASDRNATTLAGMMTNKRTSTRPATNKAIVATTKENPRNSTSTPSKQNPRSRGVSPMNRPMLPSMLPGFSDEAPPNLITSADKIQGRAISATRGRSAGSATLPSTVDVRRQSCSPSVTRGRKEADQGSGGKPRVNNTSSANGTLLVGSKMVEKMMNARRSAAGDDKGRNQANDRPAGINGRLMSKTSIDMALKQLEISKNPVGLKSSTHAAAATGSSARLSSLATSSVGAKNSRIRTWSEGKLPSKKVEGRISRS